MDIVETSNQRFLVTGSRDRHIKMFDLNSPTYRQIAILDDHSSSIVGLKFATNPEGNIYLISAASDRQIIFREYKNNTFITIHRELDKNHKIYSLNLTADHCNLLVGLDKKLNSYAVNTGKLLKSSETKDQDKVSKLPYDNLAILTDVSGQIFIIFSFHFCDVNLIQLRMLHASIKTKLLGYETVEQWQQFLVLL